MARPSPRKPPVTIATRPTTRWLSSRVTPARSPATAANRRADAQRVARVGQINLDALPPAFGGRQNGVGVKKWKGERFDPEQAQDAEKCAPREPQPGHDHVETEHIDRDRQCAAEFSLWRRSFTER